MWPLVAIDILLALVTWWHGGVVLGVVVVRLLNSVVGPTLNSVLAIAETMAALATTMLALVLVAIAGVRAGQEQAHNGSRVTNLRGTGG